MRWYYVIADDLTGANASAVLLKKVGLSPCTILAKTGEFFAEMGEYNALICSTGSRNLEADEAYERVKARMNLENAPKPELLTKRIDSTMRGNIGKEIDAVLDSLEPDYVMMTVPSFPDAGRIVRGGSLYVHGTRLEQTEAALDPKKPVSCSDVRCIIAEKSQYRTALIGLDEIRAGNRELLRTIKNRIRDGAKIILFDGETNLDLQLIANTLVGSDLKFAVADPGPFTQQVVKAKRGKESIFLLVGSINPVTTEQINRFWREYGTDTTVVVSTRLLSEEGSIREAEIQKTIEACITIYRSGTLAAVIGDGIFPDRRMDLTEACSDYVNDASAEITEQVVKQVKRIQRFYLSGGDIALTVLERMGAAGFVPLEEVAPLAVYGRVTGGLMEGCSVITKGGMAGDPDAMLRCVKYLEE